ncbi:hypothetical protein NEUTE1DRAFT_62320 [Neurospora tetrasperma FGSC 2508]|uniref:RRM domain-containing protein n=1 Tax=Neurospora tetrasperma (strain FGSC 2508 / ATCC MYA-4615 / P0657) TaxID=510951 RepID=F8MKK9_NEUT8|nr:uncharacterized protein NEUTE1DRAFT_62320 [Neurospora tetrasperma FGSC 2508]EGO57439.1 hypothetical protein NEUTE1DRAFT_62320 [Neurospora tetrasperma FGSC 2508]EGZ72303.1 hypothetical protein NEUTE2DRAFT_111816 [Neurospora tetrasperma FGSC 2509]
MGKDRKVADDFQKLIQADREKKKNEALAARIFNRTSTPVSTPKQTTGGSLASRTGVKKQRGGGPQSAPSKNNNERVGSWTVDLGPGSRSANNTPKSGGLAARITNPNAGPAGNPRQKRRAAQMAEAIIRNEFQEQSDQRRQQGQQRRQQHQQQHQAPANAPKGPAAASVPTGPSSKGFTIRGLAGPFAVMAQNFAPGTTAADIENAMTPIGGLILSCRIMKHHPIVIAEIVFESKEGADNVIATFDKQTADGRVLSVYHKPSGPTYPLTSQLPPSRAPTGPRSQRSNDYYPEDDLIDGTLGFEDAMEEDDLMANGNGRQPPRGPAAMNGGGTGGLYSDQLVRNRKGRGFNGNGGRY